MNAFSIFVAATCIGLAWSACTTDSDCPDGCCYSNTIHGSQCYQFQKKDQPCHLPNHNHTIMHYPCGCVQGLTCGEIHFTPGLPDAVHQAEMILLGQGYGMCTDDPTHVFGK